MAQRILRRFPIPLLLVLTTGAAAPAFAQTPAAAAPACRIETNPTLPLAISSFGACCSGGWLYAFGGHVGRAHEHSRDNVVGTFQRLNLADGVSWQTLPSGPALQGTALVAAVDGSLYRVGGMTAHNAAGAAEDLHSTATVARFDPRHGVWHAETPLPEPRSSHDAVVLGDHLYVVGGWNLHGDPDGTWHTTAWVADLREHPLRWQPLAQPPGPRRAAALAAFADQLVLIGGIDADGPLSTVAVLDPATGQWRNGPDLPGAAFGTAAVALGDRLFATVMDGRLLAWDGRSEAWSLVAQLESPRIFHRLVGIAADRLLALGGASRSGHLRGCEYIDAGTAAPPTCHQIVIPAPGSVALRQALILRDDTLWALGGNRATGSDRFAVDQFADDIWKVDLTARTADRVGSLPVAAQSMAVATWQQPFGAVLVGGLGVAAGSDRAGSLGAVRRFDARTGELQPLTTLPAGRTQCGVVHHGGKLWLFGGTDFTPDAAGGESMGVASDVLVCDLAETPSQFRPSGLQLPRPRRSFGIARLGDEMLLLGGLGDDFQPIRTADVLDAANHSWRQLELPRAWVSPQVAVLGDRVYVACGGTMQDRHFTEDRAVWSWSQAEGWRLVLAALPFPVRHVQMLTLRDRLLFYAANDPRGDRIVIRTFAPNHATTAVPAPDHH